MTTSVASPSTVTDAPHASAVTLRAAGRAPAVPFRVVLGDGRELLVVRLLRVLPGKRIVGESWLDGRRLLAKLFIDKDSARHWQREHRGIEALAAAGIATPAAVAAGPLPDGGHVLLTDFLDGATTLLEHWKPLAGSTPGNPAALALLTPAFRLLGQLHRAGLSHDDLHLGNFLRHGACLYLIDGDAVATATAPLGEKAAARDLAMLVAQLPRTWDGQLAPLLADPDRWIAEGTALKRGNTCTVARVELGGRALVIKRYNLKHLGHAMSRAWRPTRAWHSWREGHRLDLFGIPTPRPLALVEERWGPLRARAWLVTEYCAGPDLLTHLDPASEPPPAEAAALRMLFATLYRERISHGDLKATNLLWQGDRIALIDLDAMRQHATISGFVRSWRGDRARFLRNWPAGSPLHRWLDAMLPGIR
jgi:tRNA A-37 threonylcarbamoyl transferase component Bud32